MTSLTTSQFPDALKAIRKYKGLTVGQAARYLWRVHEWTYRKWEHGKVCPGAAYWGKIEALYAQAESNGGDR